MAAPKQFCSLLAFVACIIIGSSSIVGASWCVARSSANPQELQRQLDYVCRNGANCSAIQPGGSCFEPNTIYSHASYALDSYYVHMHGVFNPTSCYYNGVAVVTYVDPSYGGCRYPSSPNRKNEATN